jgi:hypothetical protein
MMKRRGFICSAHSYIIPQPGKEDAMFGARRLTVSLLVIGIAALVVGTVLHPGHENPNDALKAFAEYAADRSWLASHVIQLGGMVAMLLGMLAVLAQNRAAAAQGREGSLLPHTALVAASIALAGALQAVDGVALKLMVDRWASASGAQKDLLFSAALAIRFVEIGLASITSLVTGLTVIAVSYSFWSSRVGGGFLAFFGAAGGLGLVASAIAMGAGGFTGLSMTLGMPARIALMIWVAAHALIHWKNSKSG